MIKKSIKQALAKVALPLLRKHGGMQPKVFFYHGVEEHIVDKLVQTMHIEVALFEAQMKYLRRYYNVISIGEYEYRLEKGFSGNEVILTFDDGYRNNLTVAAPVLQFYELPFSVYPSVAYISTDDRCPTFILRAIILNSYVNQLDIPSLKLNVEFSSSELREKIYCELSQMVKYSSWDKTRLICDELINNLPSGEWQAICDRFESDRMLNWNELQELTRYNCEIGSHGMEHGLLHAEQPESFVERQIITSRDLIRGKIPNCEYYVYPNGGKKDVSAFAMKTVEEAGFRLAFSSVANSSMSNRFFLPRSGDVLNMTDFKLKLASK